MVKITSAARKQMPLQVYLNSPWTAERCKARECWLTWLWKEHSEHTAVKVHAAVTSKAFQWGTTASQSSCFPGEHLRSSSSIPRVVTQGDFVSKFWPGWNIKMHSVEWIGERVSSFLLVTTSLPLRNLDYRAAWLLQLLMLCIFFSTPKFPCFYSWFAS